MKKVLNNVRKFVVLALYILSIIVLFSETEDLVMLVITKVTSLTYFYMFSKANKLMD